MSATNVANRGVQARETEIMNTRVDNMDTSEMSHQPTDSWTHARSDQTASYVQVIVQKHRRPRVPTASSPVATPTAPASDEVGALPATILLAYPALAALQSAYNGAVRVPEPVTNTDQGADDEHQKYCNKPPSKPIFKREYSSSDEDADVVEVFQLERVSEVLAARGGCVGRGGRAGRTARRVRRRCARLLGSLLAPIRLLFDLPITMLLHIERCALEVVRGVLVEGAVVAAEALGKPALAATHNALAATLAAAAGAARGVREALRPLAGAVLDAAEPLARVLAALRLVHVQHVHCRCCTAPATV